MMPLLTMLSITGVAAARAVAASSCLPALSARVALRMALRSCEVSASLRARCTVDCRAAFSADFVFAKRRLLTRQRSKIGPQKSRVACRVAPHLSIDTRAGVLTLDIVVPLIPRKPEYNHGLSPWN